MRILFTLIFTLFFSTTLYAISASSISNAITSQTSTLQNHSLEFIEDAAITAYIQTQLLLEKNISSKDINIHTQHGIVFISGTVASEKQAATLLKIVSAVKGVKQIDSQKLVFAKYTMLKQDAYS